MKIRQHPGDKGATLTLIDDSQYSFDQVFPTDASQKEVYEKSCGHIIPQVINGYNSTVFAYGQTGSGKTWSMEGELGTANRGIQPRLVEDLFKAIDASPENVRFSVEVCYVEIYLNELRDLLDPRKRNLQIKSDKHGMKIRNATLEGVRNYDEVMAALMRGATNRTVGRTDMNAGSSRSHGVFMLLVEKRKQIEVDGDITESMTKSKLLMVDLAGSEKARNTGATGLLLKQAKAINLSLTYLGTVLDKLATQAQTGKGSHVSFRDSPLTYLLSDALGGNSKTTLMVCASSSSVNLEETKSTLRFGKQASRVKTMAKVNATKSVGEYKLELQQKNKMIARLQTLIKGLKKDLKLALAGKISSEADCDSLRLSSLPEEEEVEGATDDSSANRNSLSSLSAGHSRSQSVSSNISLSSNVGPDEVVMKVRDFESLKQKVAKMKTELATKTMQLEKTAAEISNYELQYEEVSTEKSSLEEKVVALRKQRDKLNAEMASVSSSFQATKNSLDFHQDKVVLLEEQYEQEVSSIRAQSRREVEKFMQEAREALEGRQLPISSSSNVRTLGHNQQSDLLHVKAKLAKSRTDLQSTNAKLSAVQRQVSEAENHTKKLRDAIRRKDQRLRNQHNQLALFGELKQETDAIQQKEVKKLKKQLKLFHDKARKAERQVQYLSVQNQSLHQELVVTKNAIGNSVDEGEYFSETSFAAPEINEENQRFKIWLRPKKMRQRSRGGASFGQMPSFPLPQPIPQQHYYASPNFQQSGFAQPGNFGAPLPRSNSRVDPLDFQIPPVPGSNYGR